MKSTIGRFNWQKERENLDHVDRIGDDIFLIGNPLLSPLPDHPFKANVFFALICKSGIARGKINLCPYATDGPYLVFMLPDQILEQEYVSEDFDGCLIVMSKRFLNGLEIEDNFPAYLSIIKQPCIPLRETELEAMLRYYTMLQRTIHATHNVNRSEVAKHLTKAFFYGIGPSLHNFSADAPINKNEMLVDNFLKLVKANYKKQRGLEFYAGKLSLTSKYMSTMIKQSSGITAGEWIDRHVILEAKALLKSSNMTIQQIGDELNFTNQSFFGKYFKRLVGVSPKEYRDK